MGEGHTLPDARIQFSSPEPCKSPQKRCSPKSRWPTEVAEDKNTEGVQFNEEGGSREESE